MGVIKREMFIAGQKRLHPQGWENMREFFAFGRNSSQPVIAAQKFTFVGDSAAYILGEFDKGFLLRGIPIHDQVTQDDLTVTVLEDYIIDGTDDFEFIEPDFAGGITNPVGISVSIKKRDSIQLFQSRIKGLSWGLLADKGAVTSSDFVVVPTAVMKLWNNTDIALASLSIGLLTYQIIQAVKETREFIIDTQQRIAGSQDVGLKASAILWIIAQSIIITFTNVAIIANSVKTTLDIIFVLIPPILKNKGMTYRRMMEIICEFLGYEFSTNLIGIDNVHYPSSPHSNETNILKSLLPQFPTNERGYPHPNDFAYVCGNNVELLKRRFNAVIDIVDGTVFLRHEKDPIFFKKGNFVPAVDSNNPLLKTNIQEIPFRRTIEFKTDPLDEYTNENYKGTSVEITNISKYLPFKDIDFIDLPIALGNTKKTLLNLEKLVINMAKVVDKFNSLLGKKTNFAQKIKSNRVSVLKISQYNTSVAKELPIVNGQMPVNARDILSAKKIENDSYINRSIVRGTGQKLLSPNLTIPFNVHNREQILGNGSYTTSSGEEAAIRTLEYAISEDTATVSLEIDFNYLAPGDFTEEITEAE